MVRPPVPQTATLPRGASPRCAFSAACRRAARAEWVYDRDEEADLAAMDVQEAGLDGIIGS